MQNNKRVYLILAIFLLILPFVMAIENISIFDTYLEYYGWVDFALYVMIFVGLTQEFMKLKFKKSAAFGSGELSQGAKAISLGLGLALAISLVTWEVKNRFYLFQIGGWIILIGILLLILGVINWLKSKDKLGAGLGSLRTALFVFVIIGIILYLFFPGLIYDYLPWSWVNSLFNILIIAAIVLLLLSLGKHGGSAPSSPGNWWGNRKSELGSLADRLANRKQRNQAYNLAKRDKDLKELELKKAEEERKRLKEYQKYLGKGIKVFINPIQRISHLAGATRPFMSAPYKRGGLKTFIVKAGYALDLLAKVEGGSKDYTIIWSVNNKEPSEFYKKSGSHQEIINIPTEALQEAEYNSLGKGKLLKNTVGAYNWKVEVIDNITKKTAVDSITIIITKNESLIKKQEEIIPEGEIITGEEVKENEKGGFFSKLFGKGKKIVVSGGEVITKGGKKVVKTYKEKYVDKKVKIDAILINLTEYKYSKSLFNKVKNFGEKKSGDLYLIPLDETIKLLGAKGKLIDKIEWWLCKDIGGEPQKLRKIQTREFSRNKLSRRDLEPGYYILRLEGYEKGKDKPTSIDSKKIYLKGDPKININFFRRKELGENAKADKSILLDGRVINTPRIPYMWYYDIWLDEKDEINKNITIIPQDIKDINPKKELHYTKDKNSKDIIEINQEGSFELNLKINIVDIFGYTEQVIIHRETRILDLSKKVEPEKNEESKKNLREIYDKEIRNEILNIQKIYEGNNRNLKTLVSNLETKQKTYNKDTYKNLILDRARNINVIEEDIRKRLNGLKTIIERNKNNILEIYRPLNEVVEENKKANELLMNLLDKKLIDVKLVDLGQGLLELPDTENIPAEITNLIRKVITFRENTVKMLDILNKDFRGRLGWEA